MSTSGQSTQRPDAERRQLTLFFCTVVDWATLARRLDPEDLRDLLSSYHRVCRDAIDRYEGHVSQFLDDGMLAYFGYPVAHEDDAVRAVHAALGILDAIKLVNQGIGKRLGVEIRVRAGLHTGVAVVGGAAPEGSRGRPAVGEAVNLAARIQESADLDAIFLSASTARLVGGRFELEALKPRVLRGFAEPIELSRVVRATGARSTFEAAARGNLTPHVGREKELADLANDWKEVQAGADRVVVVRGEAGIGKSRIVHQFRQTVLDESAHALECVCSPLTLATEFAPITEALDRRVVARAGGATSAAAKLSALGELLVEHSHFGPDVLPLMAALLSIPGVDDEPVKDLSPVRRRARTMEILRTWLASSAERLPFALLVEDAHWADPSTLDFLDSIVRDRPGGRTLVCVTGRPEFQVRWSQSHVRWVELGRLNASEVEAMATHVAGGRALPALVVGRIVARSEGVPLFVEEITKVVLESGALRLDEDHYELTRSFDERFLPTTVKGSLVARFDGLGESRQVAQLGAAIGREFTYLLIRAVSELADEALRSHLERLSRSELAFVQGEPPNAVYSFKHALIQDAIYETLLKSERARVHEQVFSKLREHFPDLVLARPEMAAYHAERAGLPAMAVPLLKEAGMRAFRRTAMVEAAKHLSHSIKLVDALPEPARTTTEIELQSVMGPAYMATLGWAAREVELSSARLRELAEARGDGAKLFQAMWGLWTVRFLRGELGRALETAQEVFEMAIRSADPILRIAGHHAVGYTRFYRGEYQDALRHATDGLALFDLERERLIASTFQLSSSCAMWTFRSQSQQVLGLAEQESESIREWGALTDRLSHAPTRAHWLGQGCFSRHVADDVEGVKALASESRSYSSTEGFTLWVPIADIFLAWVSAREGGNALEAANKIKGSLSLVHAGGTYIVEPALAGVFAETLILAQQPKAAFGVIEEALEVTQRGDLRHLESELFRLQGEAAKAAGDTERAKSCFSDAIERARSIGAKFLEHRSLLGLDRLSG